jgi:hypothetical protein
MEPLPGREDLFNEALFIKQLSKHSIRAYMELFRAQHLESSGSRKFRQYCGTCRAMRGDRLRGIKELLPAFWEHLAKPGPASSGMENIPTLQPPTPSSDPPEPVRKRVREQGCKDTRRCVMKGFWKWDTFKVTSATPRRWLATCGVLRGILIYFPTFGTA